EESPLKIMMFPWFAMGHLTTFLHISNKLAQRGGHRIFFAVPRNSIARVRHLNRFPELIEFLPLAVPHVEGLPAGAELTADVPFPMIPLILTAMDLTRPQIEDLISELRPNFVLFDFSHWLPGSAAKFGAKTVFYNTISAAAVGWLFRDLTATVDDIMRPPPGYPSSGIKLTTQEACAVHDMNKTGPPGAGELKFVERLEACARDCDSMVFKSYMELESQYFDFLSKKYSKPVSPAGPVLPEAPKLDDADGKWSEWLDKFESKSVIYCAFGSEARLRTIQFQELILGLELTGKPYLVAAKPPIGAETVEEAMPEGELSGRGVVHGGWVPQQLMLSHPSTGCFVTHCGWGSLFEGILSECQLVLMPLFADQPINARLMGGELGIGIEMEKGDEDGMFRKESVKKAVDSALDFAGGIGAKIRANHAKWREVMMKDGFDDSYIDDLILKFRALL
ncbi:glucosyltransferase, partial [Genlisea aurea]